MTEKRIKKEIKRCQTNFIYWATNYVIPLFNKKQIELYKQFEKLKKEN